jgi:hypothetical protein
MLGVLFVCGAALAAMPGASAAFAMSADAAAANGGAAAASAAAAGSIKGVLTQAEYDQIKDKIPGLAAEPTELLFERKVDKEVKFPNSDHPDALTRNEVESLPKTMEFTVTSGTDPGGFTTKKLGLAEVSFAVLTKDADGMPTSYEATCIYRGVESYLAGGYYSVDYEWGDNVTSKTVTKTAWNTVHVPGDDSTGGEDSASGRSAGATAYAYDATAGDDASGDAIVADGDLVPGKDANAEGGSDTAVMDAIDPPASVGASAQSGSAQASWILPLIAAIAVAAVAIAAVWRRRKARAASGKE